MTWTFPVLSRIHEAIEAGGDSILVLAAAAVAWKLALLAGLAIGRGRLLRRIVRRLR